MTLAAAIHSIALVVLLAVGSSAGAGVISGTGTTILPPGSTGTIGPLGVTPAPNNDDSVGASANAIAYSLFVNSPGTVDVEFVVADSAGTTEYRFPQSFLNNSGQVWTSFRFELGFGTGANFVRSGALDSLDFDAPALTPTPTSTRFTTLAPALDVFDWSGGSVAALQTVAFVFAVDVPDGLGAFNPTGQNRFTLRQTPNTSPAAVPEPSTMLLGLMGLTALALFSRRGAARQVQRHRGPLASA